MITPLIKQQEYYTAVENWIAVFYLRKNCVQDLLLLRVKDYDDKSTLWQKKSPSKMNAQENKGDLVIF